jgi:hypothetical protein
MILRLIQKNKELFAAKFVICRGAEEVGHASLQGRLGSREAHISGEFNGTTFELSFERHISTAAKAFRPYLIEQNGRKAGAVYQTWYKKGCFRQIGFCQMIHDDLTYDLYPVSFRDEGSKSPVYAGESQISQIEKDCVVHNDLHEYTIFSIDEHAALISVLFCLYMYVHACYKPGEKAVKSVTKTMSVANDPFLEEKYNPHFKDNIME